MLENIRQIYDINNGQNLITLSDVNHDTLIETVWFIMRKNNIL